MVNGAKKLWALVMYICLVIVTYISIDLHYVIISILEWNTGMESIIWN